MHLHYNSPAEKFLEGLPIGNGRLGAVSLGAIEKETLFLNDDSVWYGGFRDRVNPDAKNSIEKLRKLIFEGKTWQAEKLAFYTLTATPESERIYQPLANLELQFYYPNTQKPELSFLDDKYVNLANSTIYNHYKRKLCLKTAISKLEYCVDDVKYNRELFASNPHGAICHKIEADKNGSISFVARLSRNKLMNTIEKLTENTLVLTGQTGDNGVSYCAGLCAKVKGGSTRILGQHLIVENADEAILYITSATNYYEKNTPLKSVVLEKLAMVSAQNYSEVRATHIADYKAIFDRVDFHIENNTDESSSLATDLRLQNIKNGAEDIPLQKLLYHYGRYLQISSSRKGTLPMNLRAIWNHEYEPAWDSKFTININQQMLYWATDILNAPECAEPIFALLERMHPKGKEVAKNMYGVEGFVAHHNTDLWGDCAPQDIHRAAFWCLGGAWLALHIWDYYDHHQDEEFLQKYYPILEDASRFVLNFLVEDNSGYLVTCPSHSPENGYFLHTRNDVKPSITYAPTMDNMLIRYLFAKTIQADKILKTNSEVAKQAKLAIQKLHPTRIGKHGQIMEWVEDFDEPEPGHRHMAHMFALHPADDITPFKTPELANAAKNSIDRRLAHQRPEDGKNGWTLSWMMLFEARLHRSEKAYAYVQNMLRHAVAPNLFGLCVTDEIYVLDGNLGMVSAMTELCVQSHGEEVFLLPSLPQAWKNGYLKGIKARGGFIVDINWIENKLVDAKITATANNICTLRTRQKIAILNLEQKAVELVKNSPQDGTYIYSWQCKKGEFYFIKVI